MGDTLEKINDVAPQPYLKPVEFRQVAFRVRPESRLFPAVEDGAIGVEQYRLLNARLTLLGTHRPLRRLMISSAVAEEGKTHVAANLALVMSMHTRRRVLLVDADLRKPELHLVYGIANGHGLSDVLQDGSEPWPAIVNFQGTNLHLMTAGQSLQHPLPRLNEGFLQLFFDELAAAFDFIIIDTPPLLLIADATPLADVADGVLLVAHACATPRELVQEARDLIDPAKLLGVVVRGLEPLGRYGSGYYLSYQQVSATRRKPRRSHP